MYLHGTVSAHDAHQIDPVLSCLWDDTYKRSLAANKKEYPMKWLSRFPLALYECPLTYV